MAEEAKNEDPGQDPDVEFAVLLIKQKDGSVGLRVPNNSELPIDEVYAAVCLIKSNIEIQKTAGMIQQAMMATAQQVQGMQGKQPGNRTESGLIVPDDLKV